MGCITEVTNEELIGLVREHECYMSALGSSSGKVGI